MMVTVIIPWRPQPTRLWAFDAVTRWYRRNLPDATIVTVDSGDAVFNLARCRNQGIAGVADRDEVSIINDADTIPQRGPLLEAIEAARTDDFVHLPYTEYHWLGEDGTSAYERGMALEDCEFELVHGACSGVYVTTPSTWSSHGGQDETFRGWGFEDAAWYLAHETLLGEPPRRHNGTVFALHHEAQPRHGIQYDANAQRMDRYRAAQSNTDAMAQLVFRDSAARDSTA